MKTLRTIKWVSQRDQIRTTAIRKYWRDHVSRMTNDYLTRPPPRPLPKGINGAPTSQNDQC